MRFREQIYYLRGRDTLVSCYFSHAWLFRRKVVSWMYFQLIKVTLSFYLVNQAITWNEYKNLACFEQFSLGLSPKTLIHSRCFSVKESMTKFQSWRESTKLILQMFKATKCPFQQYIPSPQTARPGIIHYLPAYPFIMFFFMIIVYLPSEMITSWGQTFNATLFCTYFLLHPAWYKSQSMYTQWYFSAHW